MRNSPVKIIKIPRGRLRYSILPTEASFHNLRASIFENRSVFPDEFIVMPLFRTC